MTKETKTLIENRIAFAVGFAFTIGTIVMVYRYGKMKGAKDILDKVSK